MKKILVLLILLSQFVFAQQKQMSLEDAVYGKYSYLQPDKMTGLVWQNDAVFSFVEDETIWLKSVKSGEKKEVFNLDDLNTLIGIEADIFPVYSWLNEKEILFQAKSNFVLVNSKEKELVYKISLPENAENPVFNAVGKYVTFTKGNNLFVVFEGGKTIQITTDGGNGIVNGKSVHRNEFGISSGIFISPNGKRIAFYRKDESMVKDYPLVDFMGEEAKYTTIKYPMAGKNSHHVKLGVYNVESGKTVFLKTGEPLDHYLTNVAWSPNETNIYLAELNREQNHMHLNCYDAVSGEKIKTVFDEKSDDYVEPLYPIQFSKINVDEFYYLSRKDGWFHLYKYNTDGELIKQITKGEWELTEVLGFDAKEKNVFVEGTLESPLENHIYKVNVKSGKIDKLTSESGIHHGVLSIEASYLIDNWSATEVPQKSDIISNKGEVLENIHTSKDPLEHYILAENKLVTLKTSDGKNDLFGRIIKPIDFDPNKKYPVVVYVYGGPHSQLVNKGWHNSARWWQYYMASQGYIAFTLDNRGTNNRGRDFETAIHRQLGVLETEDQMQGINYLKSLPFVDVDRIGVHGWSFGGFMTLNLMLRHPETFKVGVAGGSVVDWEMYEIMYGERYMDMPQENPEGYERTDMRNYIPNLNGKLMLIHGVQDSTVVMQHSMRFLRECVRRNKQVDFFAYPTHPHNVRGKDRIHLMEKVSRYFIENL